MAPVHCGLWVESVAILVNLKRQNGTKGIKVTSCNIYHEKNLQYVLITAVIS